MKWDEMVQKAVDYFNGHDDELRTTIVSAGFTDIGDWRPMIDLEDEYDHLEPLDIMALALKSWDRNGFDTDDHYFCVKADGTLESSYAVDYSDYNDEELIERLFNVRESTDLPKYIERLFEACEEEYGDYDTDEEEE